MLALKIFAAGWLILLAAILFNALAAWLGLMSWYDFLSRLGKEGEAVSRPIRFFDLAWLFLGYPLLLGIAVWLVVLLLFKSGFRLS